MCFAIQPVISKLCTLQNIAIKLTCNGGKSDHVTPYYSKLGMLKLQALYKHDVAKNVFGFHKTVSLPHFNTSFLRHPKYFPGTLGLRQTCATYIYLSIQLPDYKKVLSIRSKNLEHNISKSKKQIKKFYKLLLQKILYKLLFNHPTIKIKEIFVFSC